MKKKIARQFDPLEPRKVGRIYEDPQRAFCYIDIKYEKGKWADSSKFLPADFDLCHCKIDDRVVSGWHSGTEWEGFRIKPKDKVQYWKLNYNF